MKAAILLIIFLILAVVSFNPCRNLYAWYLGQMELKRKERLVIGSLNEANPRIRELNQNLRLIGLTKEDFKGMNGKMRTAIREFQRRNRLAETGLVDYETWLALQKQAIVFDFDDVRENEKEGRDRLQDSVIQHRLNAKEKIQRVQLALAAAGYYKGKIDGKMGVQTRAAIKEFQKSRRLAVDGKMGDKTWREIRKLLNEKKKTVTGTN